MTKVYCKYCGASYNDVRSLTATSCPRHPDGYNKGKHVLYEGDEKSEYTCKYCGQRYRDLRSMTATSCPRHPDGYNKGKHSPAL